MSTFRRLAIVVSHPIQYYAPWFRHLTVAGFTLRVFYLWDFGVGHRYDPGFKTSFSWDIDLLSGYEHEFVPNVAALPGTDHFAGLHNPTLTARLAAWQPDAILVFGYKYRTHLGLITWATLRRIPLIFRGDSHLLGRNRLGFGKRWVLRRVYARFAAFLYVGQANRAYFEYLGVQPPKLFFAPHCVDGARFTVTPERQATADALRRSLGVGDRRIVLFAGKLVPKKQPRPLLDAFTAAGDDRYALVYVGEGPEKAALQQTAAASDACVRFLPFANQSEMPVRYLLADVFALPSAGNFETWGLAVNEAMHLGVPCLVTSVVGCQHDLVTDGVTGWVARADDPAALAFKLREAMQAVANNRERWRQVVTRRIAGYSYAAATAGLARALAHLGWKDLPASISPSLENTAKLG